MHVHVQHMFKLPLRGIEMFRRQLSRAGCCDPLVMMWWVTARLTDVKHYKDEQVHETRKRKRHTATVFTSKLTSTILHIEK